MSRRALAAVVCACVLAGISATPAAATCSQADVIPPGPTVPAGLRISSRQALDLAKATPAGRKHPAKKVVLIHRCTQWWVRGTRDGEIVFFVLIDGRNGRVLHAWDGIQAVWPFARGSSTLFVGRDMPWVMGFLTLVFLAPFVDVRRLRRRAHVDLLILVAIVATLIPFGLGAIHWSTPLVFAALCALAARMLWLARDREARSDPLVPYLGDRILLGGTALLLVGRELYNIAVATASDVGYYSVLGAQALLDGYSIYDQGALHGTAYGPAMHLAYLPFAAIFPLSGGLVAGSNNAAHAAAVTFDVLTAVALYVFGRRQRDGSEGHRLGTVLAFAWAANPLGYYASAWSANDGFIALTLVLALIALQSPAGRGVVAALAATAKWVPAVLCPLLAAGTRPPERRATLVFGLALLVTAYATALPFMPTGGVRTIYDVSVGDIATLQTPFSIWGLWHIPNGVRELCFGLVALAAVAAYWRPRTRSVATLAALATAIIAAVEAALPHWHYSYAAWFVPTGLAAIALRHERITAAPR